MLASMGSVSRQMATVRPGEVFDRVPTRINTPNAPEDGKHLSSDNLNPRASGEDQKPLLAELVKMRKVWARCPSRVIQITIVQAPFPEVGDEINGFGTVTRIRDTWGFLITPPGRAEESPTKPKRRRRLKQ